MTNRLRFSALAGLALFSGLFSQEPPPLALSPLDLYSGFKADKITLNELAPLLTLDTRNAAKGLRGEIETDVIDILDPVNQAVPALRKIRSASISTDAAVPAGARISLYVRSGPSFFSDKGWSAWEKAPALNFKSSKLKGPYLRIRYVLEAAQPAKLPAIRRAEIRAEFDKAPIFTKEANGAFSNNEKIISSPAAFAYESRDNPAIKAFVEANKLAELAKAQEDELGVLLAINDWAARCANERKGTWQTDYPWNVKQLCSVSSGNCVIRGHCMSYAAVLISALAGLGIPARHWAVNGFRDMDHEVVEAWCNQLRKWVYLDPSLDQHYQDPRTRQPLSILEMHNIYVGTFFQKGEDLNMPMEEQKKRVKGMGGGKVAPILCVDRGFHYGAAAPADYDWGWLHGYMADGFMRLTTRNNFHSKKEPWFSHFGEGLANWDVFLSWVDEKTPPKSKKITRFSGRERDFYWTMNQASIKARRKADDVVLVEFGNSMPFFKTYRISIDDALETDAPGFYEWTLHEGNNALTVTPQDQWGGRGFSSTLNVSY